MKLDLRAQGLSAGLALGALIALGVMMSGGAAAADTPNAGAAAKCNVAKNVEAILDDSGSMSGTDPDNFRSKLMSAFIGLGGNQGKTLGAVKFSTGASVLFNPQPINAGTRPAMDAAFLNLQNMGGTDYDAGFALANSDNPTAKARLFLSDGSPNQYPTTHLAPSIKTYAVGLGVGSNASAVATLSQIAAETGGPPPIFIEEAGQLGQAAGAITAGLNCKQIRTFTDVLNEQGDSAKHTTKAKGKAMDILTTWSNLDSVLGLSVGTPGAGKSTASIAKVKIRRSGGSNFASIRVKGLKKGQKVRIKIKAKALVTTTVGTTQVIK